MKKQQNYLDVYIIINIFAMCNAFSWIIQYKGERIILAKRAFKAPRFESPPYLLKALS